MIRTGKTARAAARLVRGRQQLSSRAWASVPSGRASLSTSTAASASSASSASSSLARLGLAASATVALLATSTLSSQESIYGASTSSALCEPPKIELLDGVAAGDLQDVDVLYEQRGVNGNLSRCLERLTEMYTRSTDTAEKADLCWRLARACYNLVYSKDSGDQAVCGTKEQREELAHDSLKYAQEALKVAPQDFRSHYWCGIAIQAIGEFEGHKYTITHLNEMREFFETAAKYNPRDGMSYYCLGQWCYELAELTWWQRTLVTTMYATPPTSSYEEALKYFQRAEEVQPEFWNKNALMLAKTYEKIGDKAKAAEWADYTTRRLVINPEDEEIVKQARELLARVGQEK